MWNEDTVTKNKLDSSSRGDKLIVSFDGRAVGGHPQGILGAVGEVLSAIELAQYNNTRPVKPYELGDA